MVVIWYPFLSKSCQLVNESTHIKHHSPWHSVFCSGDRRNLSCQSRPGLLIGADTLIIATRLGKKWRFDCPRLQQVLSGAQCGLYVFKVMHTLTKDSISPHIYMYLKTFCFFGTIVIIVHHKMFWKINNIAHFLFNNFIPKWTALAKLLSVYPILGCISLTGFSGLPAMKLDGWRQIGTSFEGFFHGKIRYI